MGSIAETPAPFHVKRIAVIGAGASGLSAVKYLLAENAFDTIDVYEQQMEVGGTWYYTPNAKGSGDHRGVPQTDPHVPPQRPEYLKGSSDPVFVSPMYRDLHTNIPKELMRFTDLAYKPDDFVYPLRSQVQAYLVEYARPIRHMISFGTQVQSVRLSCPGGKDLWTLTALNLNTGEQIVKEYDAVVASSGHYSVPYIPAIFGIESWSKEYRGAIMHSKYYDSPEGYKDRKVIVVGNAASGVDIGTQISTVSKLPLINAVYESSDLQDHLERKREVPPTKEFILEDRAVKFQDGSVEKDVDHVIFCTGYLYSFPFFDDDIQPPIVSNGRRARHLYQHLFHITHPTLVVPFCPQKVVPMPLGEAQAAVFARVWANHISLPPKAEMEAWELARAQEKGEEKKFHVLGMPAEFEYINGLHDWAMTSTSREGKKPPYYGDYHRFLRLLGFDPRKVFDATGRTAKSLEELGFTFEKWKAEQDELSAQQKREQEQEQTQLGAT